MECPSAEPQKARFTNGLSEANLKSSAKEAKPTDAVLSLIAQVTLCCIRSLDVLLVTIASFLWSTLPWTCLWRTMNVVVLWPTILLMVLSIVCALTKLSLLRVVTVEPIKVVLRHIPALVTVAVWSPEPASQSKIPSLSSSIQLAFMELVVS